MYREINTVILVPQYVLIDMCTIESPANIKSTNFSPSALTEETAAAIILRVYNLSSELPHCPKRYPKRTYLWSQKATSVGVKSGLLRGQSTGPTNPSVRRSYKEQGGHLKRPRFNPNGFIWVMLKTMCTVTKFWTWTNWLGTILRCCCFFFHARSIRCPPTHSGWTWLSAWCMYGKQWCTYWNIRTKVKRNLSTKLNKHFVYNSRAYLNTFF